MAYNDDAVLAKLSALNETQESIVTVAQWVMFHRRHADRTGQLWLQRLKDSGSNKRLNLIYLANEVAQQSKARKKDDFLVAFSPVIAEATATAYKGATNEVQQKLRRVVEVWRARQIFEIPVQESVEAKIDELDKTRTSGKRMGGSLFSSSSTSSVPSELRPLVEPQQTVTKLVLSTKTSVNGANHEYDRITDPLIPVPSPPVHAARLNGVLKNLANAEGAVAEGIKARSVLIEELEKLLKANTDALAADNNQLNELASRRVQMDRKKNEVEDNIMRGFASNSNPGTPSGPGASPGAGHSPITPVAEPDRPEVEALTPPGYPQPDGEPVADFNLEGTNGAQPPAQVVADSVNITKPASAAGSDLLSSLSTSYGRPATPKKRKLNMANDFDIGGDAMDGLDADVAEMLWKENKNGH
ncbi:RNA polymerase II-binding domain-containing protein [Amylocarpus encephaloides]|uniref:RNA polymerase II-binding domain-containing protein n=1 Tax=Amylocarpus encephaloides TaxID=45428 RepID=A0A9P7YP50_9HELO|nr:RNA polymerase II-binding domain-containing protein [Amylocarpus encephaloides]